MSGARNLRSRSSRKVSGAERVKRSPSTCQTKELAAHIATNSVPTLPANARCTADTISLSSMVTLDASYARTATAEVPLGDLHQHGETMRWLRRLQRES